MKYIKNFKLFESTRLDKYIKDNPDYIKDFDTKPPSKNDFTHYYNRMLDNKEYGEIKNKYIERNPLLNKSFYTSSDGEKPQQYNISRYKLINIDHIDRYLDRDFDKFINNLDSWSYISKNFDDKILSEIKENWDVLYKQIRNYNKEIDAFKNRLSNKLNKIAKRKGVSRKVLEDSIDWLIHYTDMSGKKIPKEIFDALNHITVDKNDYPLTVYRGIFYDGAKIKDKEKFLKKWYKGSKPKLKNRKATSWSTDISVAKSFMTDQDMVKDNENGYHMMLKYDITNPDDVVADLRKLDWLGFWSQQEILLSPSATDYEVLEMFPYTDNYYKDENKDLPYRKYINNSNLSNYGGMSGKDIKSIIKNDLFNAMLSNLPYDKKIEILSYKDKKVKDVMNMTYGNEQYGELNLALYQFVKNMWAKLEEFISYESVKVSIGYNFNSNNKGKYNAENIVITSLQRQPLNFVFEIDFSNVDIDNNEVTVDDIIKQIESEYHIQKNKNIKIKYIK